MVFSNFQFIFLFLPFVVLVHELIKKPRWQIYFLIIASWIFFDLGSTKIARISILISICFNYAISLWIPKSRSRIPLIIGLLFNIALLIYFKYGSFFIEIFQLNPSVFRTGTVFPLALSFYTFQQIAYLIDCYKSKHSERNLANYGHFILFFPQLINGPIMRYREMSPQIHERKKDPGLLTAGWICFLIGFTKKFFIADSLGLIVDPLFSLNSGLTFQQSIIATLGYTFQIYFDFSGYSDMAIGVGAMFGFRIPVNFNSPYKARSVADFWRRWHMTLSQWLRDYLYIPMGGNRKGEARQYLSLMITMLICGLWHGQGWTFFLWGCLHGTLLVISNFYKKHVNIFNFRYMGVLFTFCSVALLWVLFRAKNVDQAMMIYRGFINFEPWQWNYKELLILVCFVIVAMPNSQKIAHALLNKYENAGAYLHGFQMRFSIYSLISCSILIIIMFGFYFYRWDLDIYKKYVFRTDVAGINNQKGDFRSNLFLNEVFQGNENRVVIVGSSFTMSCGAFRFDNNGRKYRSGTIGIGGNFLNNGLRSAMSASSLPGVSMIILGISPLNMGPIHQNVVFASQGMEGLNLLGFPFKQSKLGSVFPLDINLTNITHIITGFAGKHCFQFHEFLGKFSTHLMSRQASKYETIQFDTKTRNDFLVKLETELEQSKMKPVPVKNTDNGKNETFKWEKRGIMSSIMPGGDVYKALKNLHTYLNSRNVRLVVYDTPTPDYDNAANIYPKGFLETYRKQMQTSTKALKIEYYDLIDFFPWTGEFMNDFIHPSGKARKYIHKYLLIKTLAEG